MGGGVGYVKAANGKRLEPRPPLARRLANMAARCVACVRLSPRQAPRHPAPPEQSRAIKGRRLASSITVAIVAIGAQASPPAGAAFAPNDPGLTGAAGGWLSVQWNFAGRYGVNAPGAWQHLIEMGRPGGAGVIVAIVDTGVAYRDAPPYRRSPNLRASQLIQGHDFVDNDAFPDDRSGHGTFMASVVAETTDDAIGLTGLAYEALIMPVRVLDASSTGSSTDIARGITWAAKHGANVINLSVAFEPKVKAAQISDILSAITLARSLGVVVVVAAGNTGRRQLALPARAPDSLSVGATTANGCLWALSNYGPNLDLVAPGGGADARISGDWRCHLNDRPRGISQGTQKTDRAQGFGPVDSVEGTSAAAPHVAAAAALVIASGVLGAKPTPADVEAHLKRTARDLGRAGRDDRYGAGLLDAAAATGHQHHKTQSPPAA